MAQEALGGLGVPDRRKVFVIHGRDAAARSAMFLFLRELDLRPLEWEELVHDTGSVSPFTGEVVARAFESAQAVIVLFTPDDEARLHEELRRPEEPDYEVQLTAQPRQNVLLEAGMALGYQPTRTIFVELGHLRPISDLAGRNVIRLDGTVQSLHSLAGRLEAAGCLLNRTSPNYLDAGRFSDLSALHRGSGRKASEEAGGITGALLAVRLSHEGASDYIFEVSNRGPVALSDVQWRLPQNASNWRLRTNVLHEYPIKAIATDEVVRVPAMIGTGGPSTVVVELLAIAPNGENYVVEKRLSIFDSSGGEWK